MKLKMRLVIFVLLFAALVIGWLNFQLDDLNSRVETADAREKKRSERVLSTFATDPGQALIELKTLSPAVAFDTVQSLYKGAKNSTDRERLLEAAAGIDAPGVEAWLRARLEDDERPELHRLAQALLSGRAARRAPGAVKEAPPEEISEFEKSAEGRSRALGEGSSFEPR